MDVFNKQPSCDHPHETLRRKTFSNGTEHVVRQCSRCGRNGGSVAKASMSSDEIAGLPEWDETLRESWKAKVSAYWDEVREERKHTFEQRRDQITREYHEYLQSPDWRRRRNKRLAMDGGRCQAQLDGCTGHATEVHHLSYDLRPEPLFNLVSICRNCHEAVSEMEGRIRRTAVA